MNSAQLKELGSVVVHWSSCTTRLTTASSSCYSFVPTTRHNINLTPSPPLRSSTLLYPPPPLPFASFRLPILPSLALDIAQFHTSS